MGVAAFSHLGLLAALGLGSGAPCHWASRADAAPGTSGASSVPLAVREPDVEVTLPWLLLQLLPSPGAAFGDRGAVLDLQWQVTPIAYSFGMDPRLVPWRWFVVEPIVRHSGSIELYFTPEYLAYRRQLVERWGWRVGTRAYFPVLHRGDYLSVSVGTSYFELAGERGAAYELGAYLLFGVLGAQVKFAPGFDPADVIATVRLRFF